MMTVCENRLTIDADPDTLTRIDRRLRTDLLKAAGEGDCRCNTGDYYLVCEPDEMSAAAALLAARYPKAAFSHQYETDDGQYCETVYLNGAMAYRITGRIERCCNAPVEDTAPDGSENSDQLLVKGSGCIHFREYLSGKLVTRLEGVAEVQR